MAKTSRRIKQVCGIHPDDTSSELWRDIKGEVHVLGPKRGGKPIARVIGDLDRLRRGAERGCHQHGAKDFGLHQM